MAARLRIEAGPDRRALMDAADVPIEVAGDVEVFDRYVMDEAEREYHGPYGGIRHTARRFVAEVSSAPKLRALGEQLGRSEQQCSAMRDELHGVVREAADREAWWTSSVRALENDVQQNAEARDRMVAAAGEQWALQRAQLVATIGAAEARSATSRMSFATRRRR